MSRTLKLLGGALLVVAVGFYSAASFAQVLPDYTVTYYSGNISSLPDETVRVIDTGFIGDPDNASGDICANFYVFDTVQEMVECCSCLITADALLVSSVQKNLTANPLTGVVPVAGVIKLVSSFPVGTPPSCDPTMVSVLPARSVMAAWGSHLQTSTSNVGFVSPSETELEERPLSAAEFTDLVSDCTDTLELGSGQGACSCPALK